MILNNKKIINDLEYDLQFQRHIFYTSINETGKSPTNTNHSQLYSKGMRQTRWLIFQILADLRSPQSVLFLGASLGGDIIGASKMGLEVSVCDPDDDVLRGIKYLCKEVNCTHGSPDNYPHLKKFDIIIISPWWVIEINKIGQDWTAQAEKISTYLKPNGSCIFHARTNLRNPFLKRITGFTLEPYFFNNLCGIPHSQIITEMEKNGYSCSISHIYKDLVNPRIIFSNNNAYENFLDFILGKRNTWKTIIKKIVLYTISFIRIPPVLLFPGILLVFKKANIHKSNNYDPLLMRGSLHVTSSIGKFFENHQYFRHSIGGKYGSKEANLLNYMGRETQLRTYLNLPIEEVKLCGVSSISYPLIFGHDIHFSERFSYLDQLREFLLHLSRIKPPDMIPSGYTWLQKKLFYQLGKEKETLKTYHIWLAKKALERLRNKDVLCRISHGELASHNIRIRNDGTLIVIDWVQAYIGHPLIDWWTFLYWPEAPKEMDNPPSAIRMGLSKETMDDLWLVWRTAYK